MEIVRFIGRLLRRLVKILLEFNQLVKQFKEIKSIKHIKIHMRKFVPKLSNNLI